MAIPNPEASRAVLVGVASYTRLDRLPPVAAGVTRMAELLRDPQVWGLPPSHITLLDSQASRDSILGAIRDAAPGCTDTFLLYFAGHGLRDRNEGLHLALADADDDHPEIASIPYPELKRVMGRAAYRAQRRITLLDCCYSGLAGGMGTTTLNRPDLAQLLEQDDDDADGGPSGSCMLTSAPKTGRSFALPGAPYPEFTGALIDILEHGISGAGPVLNLDQIWRHARRRLRQQGYPEPQQFGHNTVARQDWVHNRAHNQPPPTRPNGTPDDTAPWSPTATPPPRESVPTTGTPRVASNQATRPAPVIRPPTPPVSPPPAGRGLSRRRVLVLITAAAAVAGGIAETIALTSHDPDPNLWRLRWRFNAQNQLSGTTVANGIVYVGSGDYHLYAVDAATGMQKWAYLTGGQVNSTPTVVGGVVYFGSNDHNVYALDAATGTKKWAYKTDGAVYSSPAVVRGVVYVGGWDRQMYALDAATGVQKWTFLTGGQTTAPVVSDGVLYIGSNDHDMYALNAATGTKKWSSPAPDQLWGGPTVAGGVIYIGCYDHRLYALDMATGTQKWSYPTGFQISSPPAVAGSTVFVSSGDNYVYALNTSASSAPST
jgi:hypothetical protein